MFANCQMGGVSIATPDVCTTPVGPSVVPIPYPNIAQNAMADPSTAVQKVLINGAPAHTLQTIVPTSSGDEAGVIGGVMSGMIMGQCRHLMGASNVLIGGMPATRMTDTTGQNGSSFNVQGSTMSPSQTKVIINSGGSSGGSQGASSAQKSKKPQRLTIKNPRWEHVDQKVAEQRKKLTLIGDKVTLKVDVTGVPDGTSVTFKIFDIAKTPPKQMGMAYGEVTGGIGSAEWKVSRFAKLKFEGKVRCLTSERADLSVASVWVFSF